jgi:hypothetical protein
MTYDDFVLRHPIGVVVDVQMKPQMVLNTSSFPLCRTAESAYHIISAEIRAIRSATNCEIEKEWN